MAQKLDIDEAEAGSRLDRWLRRKFPAVSFAQAQKILRTGDIRVNGKRAKGDYRLQAGDDIKLPPFLSQPEFAEPLPKEEPAVSRAMMQQFAQSILYEDDFLIAINKWPGIAVQGGSKTTQHIDGIAKAWGKGKIRPLLVHRLDKDTTGVLVLAKTPKAAAFLTKAFAEKDTQKIYWAIVEGSPLQKSGQIDVPLRKKASMNTEKVEVDFDGGEDALTHFRMLDHRKNRALLELRPITGRTHQLRVHCAHMGFPIMGDVKYGASGKGRANLHLHARQIIVPHIELETIQITAPLPEHFTLSLKQYSLKSMGNS